MNNIFLPILKNVLPTVNVLTTLCSTHFALKHDNKLLHMQNKFVETVMNNIVCSTMLLIHNICVITALFRQQCCINNL